MYDTVTIRFAGVRAENSELGRTDAQVSEWALIQVSQAGHNSLLRRLQSLSGADPIEVKVHRVGADIRVQLRAPATAELLLSVESAIKEATLSAKS